MIVSISHRPQDDQLSVFCVLLLRLCLFCPGAMSVSSVIVQSEKELYVGPSCVCSTPKLLKIRPLYPRGHILITVGHLAKEVFSLKGAQRFDVVETV